MDSAEVLDLLGNANRRRILRLLARKPCYVTEISEYLGVSPKAVIDHLERLEAAGLVESRTDDRRRKYFSIASTFRLEVDVSPYEFGTKSAYPASEGLDVSRCRYVSIDVSPRETEPADDGDEDEAGERPDEREEHDTDSTQSLDETADGTSVAGAGTEDAAEGAADGASGTARSNEPDAEGGDGDSADRSDPTPAAIAADLGRLEELARELSLAQRWVQGQLTRARDQFDATVDDGDGRLYAAVVGSLARGQDSVEAISRDVQAPPDAVEETLAWLAENDVARRRDDGWELRR